MKIRKSYAAVLLFLGVLAFFRLTPPSMSSIHAPMSPFLKSFPQQIGNWAGKELVPDERTLEILETRNVLSREYTEPSGARINLLLVSSDKDRRVAHPPEVCYLGSNFNIVEDQETLLTGTPAGDLKVKEFHAFYERNPDQQEEVLYLYKVGNRFTTNYYAQQLQFAFDRFSRKETQVMLIRLSGSTREDVRRFLSDLLPHLM